MTLTSTCLSNKLAVNFVLYCYYLVAHCLRATSFKHLCCLNLAKGLVVTDSHLTCFLLLPPQCGTLTEKANPHKEGSKWPIKKFFRWDFSETNSLETRREYCQSSNGVTCARPLKKLIKAERVEEVVLMHVWLSGIKALLDTNSYFWPEPCTLIGTKWLFLLVPDMSYGT
jgi:hypothetical protein